MDTCDNSVIALRQPNFTFQEQKITCNEQLVIKFQKILGTKIYDTEIQTHTSK